jgi:YesN/AraC family two-component response regulator
MYRVYLVDDEPLALSQMEMLFPWQEHGFIVCGVSTDPIAAAAEVSRVSPDVVFTDIHMASLDGLSLIRQLKEVNRDMLFVVVSAYDRFEYAREMLRLEGFDYLIKPLEEKQCAELLTRLEARLSQRSPAVAPKPATSSAELNLILTHLSENFAQKISLTQIAQQFAISPNYICRLFSKHVGNTFSSHLTKLRMEHAASLLHNAEHSVKEVASQSGYDDYFYFCRVFRDTYGCTPTQYRNQL